ncbi:MAG: ATP-dependent DNA helicase UvrD2 [Thermoleophilia bacterium]|nr:ATP-dependent DNA helicase UvrD2 [Thermoleophilia bacterium]
MRNPPPAALGRGVVVATGDPVPHPWAGAREVTVDEAALAAPGQVVAGLHAAWAAREPVVVRLAVDPARFREPRSHPTEPWRLDAAFEVWGDRLHFLVWANTYDARDGREPVWWWARKAERLGAAPVADGPGDVLLPGGRAAWVDGGPRGPLPDLGAAVVHRESVDGGSLAVAPGDPGVAPADLAPDQAAAVLHGAGPARVIAPAGSGKTRVLAERLRHLLGVRGVEPGLTLAVAYNRRAQAELESRCAAFRPRVETLNALGYALVARHRGARPPVMDDREVRRLVESLVPRQRRRANTDPIAPYLEALSEIRLGLRDPAEVETSRDDVDGLAEAFGPYREALSDRGVVDFDEQVYAAVEALLADGPFRRVEQARHRHLLVDEFQDLTPAHLLLVRLLAAPELEVFGVGDDDQVIYGHAGADPAFLVDFGRYFPGAADHPLTVNYRCPAAVVAGAVRLLAHNRRRVPKDIHAGPDAETSPEALRIRTVPSERAAETLLAQVRAWVDAGHPPSGIAVLTRVNSLLLAPQVVLATAGIPVDSRLEAGVLQRTGVRAALAYLRIATASDGFPAADVIEVLRRPSRGLPIWVERWFRGTRMHVRDVRAAASRMDDERVGKKVEGLADDLQVVIDAARGGTTRDVLRTVKDRVGLGSAMALLDSSGAAAASHLDDLEALEQVADLHPDPAGFEPWLRDVLATAASGDGVTLSTVHRVKGMEWDRVVVAGVTDGIVPHRLAEDTEEERRVLHVAITRARREAVVLGDAGRVSPFLGELDGSVAPRPAGAPEPPRATDRPRHRAPAPAAVTAQEPLTGRSAAAEAALRAWRGERAKRDRVPPYVVLHDKHIVGIARRLPTSMAELARCDGMGPARLDRYGDEILGALPGPDAAA